MDVGFDKPNICALIIGTELEIVGKLENQRDRVRRVKIFDMDIMKRVSRVIRPYLCTFLYDQLFHPGHGLEYDSLSMSMSIFASMCDS